MARLLAVLVFGAALVYGVVAVTNPWALHIGGRWTPLLYWSGSGNLSTSVRSHRFYVYLYPSSHFSRLQIDGLRPTGGVQGKAWLCTSPGVMQYLTVSGTIYGGWRSTEGSLMGLRFVEPTVINLGQGRGYFDLFGNWKGPQLVMNDRGHVSGMFRSGLKLEHASATLDFGSYSDFNSQCGSANK